MAEISDFIQKNRKKILEICAKHGATNVRLFGSQSKNQAQSKSDLDLLVKMNAQKNFLDLVSLWQELEECLGCKVDVLTDAGLSPYLKDQILAEAVSL